MAALVVAGSLLAPPARAQDAAAQIVEIDRRALAAYDDFDFAKARSLLEGALALAEKAGIQDDAGAARTHLFLGMVLLEGFSLRDEAVAQFQIALRLQPEIAPPAGLFNPETAALFRVARTSAPAARADAPPPASPAPRRHAKPAVPPRARDADDDQTDEADEAVVEKDAEPRASHSVQRSFVLALALGTGGGTATGQLDMHGVSPSTAPGGFARSEAVHMVLGFGYFWSPSWLLSVEGRYQLVTGATPHCPSASVCADTADSALAALAKVTRFFTDGGVQPFATAGVGGGAIRQRVKLNGLPDCGRTGDQQCYDTVAGGPIFVAAGGGLAYRAGPLLLQAAATANVGFPSFMLNVDLTLGVGIVL
jgi:hypothetical protein